MTSPDAVKKAQIVIANSIEQMAKVADLVDRFGAEHAIPQRVVDSMNVCLDELLNNTISYRVLEQQGMNFIRHFPPIRVWGTVGFIIAMWCTDFSGSTLTTGQL